MRIVRRNGLLVGIVAAILVVLTTHGSAVPTADKTSDQLTALRQQRRDTLAKRLAAIRAMYEIGTRSQRDVSRAQDLVIMADLELETDRQKRIALHQKRVDNLRGLEQVYAVELKAGIAEHDEYLAMQAERLAAEIALLEERAGQGK